jgi:hypothetical protein
MRAKVEDYQIALGAIYDFAAFLTTRKRKLVLSHKHNAAPLVEAIKEFMEVRNIPNIKPDINWDK